MLDRHAQIGLEDVIIIYYSVSNSEVRNMWRHSTVHKAQGAAGRGMFASIVPVLISLSVPPKTVDIVTKL